MPPPFYFSLIIGDKLFYNCMIDPGASSSIMPKCVADLMDIKYDPMVSDVLKLDGGYLKTIGVLKNIEMALHACPGWTFTQDISVVDVKTHFSSAFLGISLHK